MENEQTDTLSPDEIHHHRHLISPYYFSRAKGEILIGLLAALITSALFLEVAGQEKVLPLLAATICLYLVRLFLTPSSHSKSATQETSYLLFSMLLLVSGVLWGMAGSDAVQQSSEIHKFGLLTWIICLAFLVTLVYSGRLSLVMAFSIPALGIPAFISYTRVMPAEHYIPFTLLAVAAFLFLITAIYRRSFLASLLARAEHRQLEERNETLVNHVQKLQLELKTTVETRQQVVKKLTTASDSLDRYKSSNKNLVNTLKSNLKTDPITNLPNRNSFEETLEIEWQRAVRNKEPISLAYIKVDDFEDMEKEQDKAAIFDTLKKIGSSIKSHGRRAGDLPARLEQSNFALLLLGADSKSAEKIIENLRKNINLLGLPGAESGEPVTVHAGLASLVPTPSSKPEALFERVESAVYEAEFQGGDRVVSFHSFDSLEITKWNPEADGELNEANFQQKLLSQGYISKRENVPPKTVFKNQSFSKDTLFAVYSGRFRLNIEGQDYDLKKGNSLILPAEIPFSAEVVDNEQVILFLEKR